MSVSTLQVAIQKYLRRNHNNFLGRNIYHNTGAEFFFLVAAWWNIRYTIIGQKNNFATFGKRRNNYITRLLQGV